jgi:chitinase
VSWSTTAGNPQSAPSATVSSNGLQREVFGFLPYWELSDSSTTLDFSKLSTIAYFGVGVDAGGNLQKRNSDGTTTVGWSGWTSSKMTNLINTAHGRHTRVVLTIQSFAWTSGQRDRQKRFLGSSAARANLARQVAAAVRNRGADGVNLDLEPLVSGYEDEFVSLVRRIRTELNIVRSGYQFTIDTTGSIGNYPIERATASGAADAILIMGYDYRTGSSNQVGSVAPLSRTGYDIRETVRAYRARVPASKLILGVPYYGRAWSTNSDDFNATNISGTKYGASTTVVYSTAIDYLAEHGRHYNATEGVAWTAYRRENCTSTYGCVTPWRQLYVDDAQALRAKYDLINSNNLRGAGIWALGYDGTRTELWKAIGDKFAPDTKPPKVGIKNVGPIQPNPAFQVAWTGTDASGIASYDVQVSVNGGSWYTWLSKTTHGSAVYPALDGRGYAFRVRARDPRGNTSSWTATTKWLSSPKIATGGFGRVLADGLSMRKSASSTSSKVGELDSGDIVAITGGPVSAGGYVWRRVTGPVREWGVVGSVQRDVWIATKKDTTKFVTAAPAPNTATVRAVIGRLGIGDAGIGATANTATGLASRAFSPDGDGYKDTLRISWVNGRDLDALELRLIDTDGTVAGVVPLSSSRFPAGAHGFTWDGTVGGSRLANGQYLLALVGSANGTTYSNPSQTLIRSAQFDAYGIRIDTTSPTLTTSASPTQISPNGDGSADSTALRWSSTESLTGGVKILKGSTVVRSWTVTAKSSGAITWTGKNDAGASVADGAYTFRIHGRDRAGNPVVRDVALKVDRTLRDVGRTLSRFYPQDGDRLKPSTRVAYTLTRSARATLEILRDSTLVRTVYRDRSLAAGTYGWTWNGRDAAGSYVSRGTYTLRLSATSSVGTTVVNRNVLADAFRTALSANTRSPGQKLTVTVKSVEPLRAAPRIALTQDGASAVTKTGTLLSSGEYRVTFTIASGAPGTARISVVGTDTSGGTNRSFATVVVH